MGATGAMGAMGATDMTIATAWTGADPIIVEMQASAFWMSVRPATSLAKPNCVTASSTVSVSVRSSGRPSCKRSVPAFSARLHNKRDMVCGICKRERDMM